MRGLKEETGSSRDQSPSTEKATPESAAPNAFADLIARVEKATCRLDIETLGRVICAALGREFGSAELSCGDDGSDDLTVWDSNDSDIWNSYRSRAPDISVDAALALKDLALPGYAAAVGDMAFSEPHKRPWACLWTPEGEPKWSTEASTHALALTLALLRALAASTGHCTGEPTEASIGPGMNQNPLSPTQGEDQ